MATPIQNKDITYLTTMKTKVVADWYVEATTPTELAESVAFAKSHEIPYILIGGGSNTVIVTPRVEALVIKNRDSRLEVVGETDESVEVKVSGGYMMPRLVSECIERGWSGLEYHRGLPGSVGGAIYMNSKWTHPVAYVGDVLISATLLTPAGEVKTADRAYFEFAYDYSHLHKTHEIVLDVTFRFQKEDVAVVRQRADEALAHRTQTQPKATHTCGCFFQNITDEEAEAIGVSTKSAGNLIDKVGMKGVQYGSFMVSTQHANFILDEKGSGDPKDLLKLVQEIKKRVHDAYGITLREEVVVIV